MTNKEVIINLFLANMLLIISVISNQKKINMNKKQCISEMKKKIQEFIFRRQFVIVFSTGIFPMK